ncbi:hypothetical protein NPIL_143521 [Nephila pilipes]|uniref:Uncharacterized protein n=1 Tax=Nephila pilipes TaxID=299642 RepID=A0A8X6U801_NEPPI|nr:hypothetical protein NPIL_143521 [Nephila pilipes]
MKVVLRVNLNKNANGWELTFDVYDQNEDHQKHIWEFGNVQNALPGLLIPIGATFGPTSNRLLRKNCW